MATSSSRISRIVPVFISSAPISWYNCFSFAPRPSSPSSSFLHRSPSPSPTGLIDLKSVSVVPPSPRPSGGNNKMKKRGCMCAPTTHPGSFRCSLHRSVKGDPHHHHTRGGSDGGESPRQWNRLQISALKNTLVRSGAAKEEWSKTALESLMRRPSSPTPQKRKGRSFHHRPPSRLSTMSKAKE